MQIYENLLSKMMHLKNTTTRREGVRITETIPMTFLFNMGLKLPTILLKQKIVERMIRTNTFFARLARSGIVIVGKDYKNIRFGFRSKYVLLFSWVICRVIQFCYCFEFIMKSKDILAKPSLVSCFLILTSPDDSVIYNTPKVFQWFPQAGERLIGIFRLSQFTSMTKRTYSNEKYIVISCYDSRMTIKIIFKISCSKFNLQSEIRFLL